MLGSELFKGKNIGELYSVIVFDNTINLKIVSDSLEVDNHRVWQITDSFSLLTISSFFTCIAHVVTNSVGGNVFV